MLINFLKKNLFLLLLFYNTSLFAVFTDINQGGVSLLTSCAIYLDDKQLALKEIIEQELFEAYDEDNINIGTEKKTIWLKIELQNNTDKDIFKILLFYSTFLEHIYFYDEKNLSNPQLKGQAYIQDEQSSIGHYYKVKLEANSKKTYYVKTYSDFVSVRFRLSLEDEKVYLKKDRIEQAIDIFLIGFIVALMLYSLFIAAYVQDKSYFFYSLYLAILLYDQIRFIGMAQLYYSEPLMLFDLTITIDRIYALLIASSFFTIYFLGLKKYATLFNIYKVIIAISLMAILFLDNSQNFGMTLALLLTLFLAIYNLFVGVYTYLKGEKQARLYIIGFGIVFTSYLMIIADITGLISVTHTYSNTLLWSTAFEALVLSLAFSDRYTILQNEKKQLNNLLLTEANNRESMIKKEVITKTLELEETIYEKELLLQEVHHRVKNNLQIILSMIELQNTHKGEASMVLDDLENRINAIAKTYELLIVNDNLQNIEMNKYINSLLTDIEETFYDKSQNIQIESKIEGTLPLKDAIYVGLIVNELVTNSYKYAFDNNKGLISIELLQEDNKFKLTIKDNGKGFELDKDNKSFGLELVSSLVEEQLNGVLEVDTQEKSEYRIHF